MQAVVEKELEERKIPTKEELERKHEDECPNWKLLCGMNRCLGRAVDDSLHGLVLSIIAIILAGISIGLHFV